MGSNPNVAEAASILSDSSRAAMLTALMDGRFHTATELAFTAGIKPQTASFHLAKMTAAGLATVEKHGRYRYFSLANEQVASVVESILSISRPAEVRSFRQSTQEKALRFGRTCYDHLAGRLGVTLTHSMVQKGWLQASDDSGDFELTANGESFFSEFGLDIDELRNKRRSLSRKCLDWSERQHHLAGALGSALAGKMFELEWIERKPSTRAIIVTKTGCEGLRRVFDVDLEIH